MADGNLGARIVRAAELATAAHLAEAVGALAGDDPGLVQWRQRLEALGGPVTGRGPRQAGGAGGPGGWRSLSGATPEPIFRDEALSDAMASAAGDAPRRPSLFAWVRRVLGVAA